MTVRIVTDSAATIPAAAAAEHDIDIVPMYLKFGDETYRDGVDIPPGYFYERLQTETVPVSTAGASVGDFHDAFAAALKKADAVVCVTVASFVSVTHTSATIAARDFGGRVIVVDSASASMGEGFIALEAARAARSGADADAVAARARDVSSRTQVVATINTFEYLKRSGRVHALMAYAGTALGIKPVFAFRGGKVEQLGRPRSRGKAVDKVADEARTAAAQGPLHLAVCHAAAPDEAAALLDRLTAELNPAEAHLAEFTPLMGAHTGPGLLGAAFWS
ncbi:MAG TPA: DegV family protein [Actinomycetota bacterium]|nr:DegV family protein [Actinomycetota bacterium]